MTLSIIVATVIIISALIITLALSFDTFSSQTQVNLLNNSEIYRYRSIINEYLNLLMNTQKAHTAKESVRF